MPDLRRLLQLTEADINRIVFHDSKTLGGDGLAGPWRSAGLEGTRAA